MTDRREPDSFAGWPSLEPEPLADDRLRCVYCGDVIGVYERLVCVVEGQAEESSRAAQPALSAGSPGLIYHAVCHELSHLQAAT